MTKITNHFTLVLKTIMTIIIIIVNVKFAMLRVGQSEKNNELISLFFQFEPTTPRELLSQYFRVYIP